jgi:methylated-DNA-[protein]-cysteine S-methyltransferase
METQSIVFATAFGECRLAWNEAGLTGFRLPANAGELREASEADGSGTEAAGAPPWVQAIVARVREHLSGQMHDFSDIALDWSRVSSFQRAVYLHTQGVKAGYKKSYGEIAALAGQSARAVGVALATNPWPLIVPCHRIVSADDKMTGFSAPGGVRTKTRLLALEGAELLSE